MSTNPINAGAIDLYENSPADVGPVGANRLVRKGGALQQSVDGGAFATVAGLTPTQTTQLAFLSGLPSSAAATFHLSKVPTLTGFRGMWAGQYPPGLGGVLATGDPFYEGGGESNSGAGAMSGFATSWFQKMKTTAWALRVRGKLQVPTSGKVAKFVMSNDSSLTHAMFVGSVFATDATKWCLGVEASVVAGSIVADSNMHNFDIISDATTVTLYVDEVAAATRLASSFTTDESMYFGCFATDAKGAAWTEVYYSFIAP